MPIFPIAEAFAADNLTWNGTSLGDITISNDTVIYLTEGTTTEVGKITINNNAALTFDGLGAAKITKIASDDKAANSGAYSGSITIKQLDGSLDISTIKTGNGGASGNISITGSMTSIDIDAINIGYGGASTNATAGVRGTATIDVSSKAGADIESFSCDVINLTISSVQDINIGRISAATLNTNISGSGSFNVSSTTTNKNNLSFDIDGSIVIPQLNGETTVDLKQGLFISNATNITSVAANDNVIWLKPTSSIAANKTITLTDEAGDEIYSAKSTSAVNNIIASTPSGEGVMFVLGDWEGLLAESSGNDVFYETQDGIIDTFSVKMSDIISGEGYESPQTLAVSETWSGGNKGNVSISQDTTITLAAGTTTTLNYLYVSSGCKLTIKGSGTLTVSTGNATYAIYNLGNITVSSGNITVNNNSNSGNDTNGIYNIGGTITVSDGSLTVSSTSTSISTGIFNSNNGTIVESMRDLFPRNSLETLIVGPRFNKLLEYTNAECADIIVLKKTSREEFECISNEFKNSHLIFLEKVE